MPDARRCAVCDRPAPFDFVFEDGGFRLVRCPGCRLVFQDPQPGPDVLAGSYYHDPSFTEALHGPLRDFTLERARQKLPLLRAAGTARSGARVLDVGCSSGAWLDVAASEGMIATGVEIGEATAAAARRRGLDVHTGTLAQAMPELDGERFDLITFWDVLEHLPDPRGELSAAAELLRPGGMMAATLPNIEGWYPRATYRLIARLAGAWEHPELPLHLYDFSPRTAELLLQRTGYRVVALRTLNTPFEYLRTTALSLERLRGTSHPRALRLAFEALHLGIYPLARMFDRGNSMFVAAERGAQA